MNEKALLFGEPKTLAGIVTDPTPGVLRRDLPAVVILNAGIVHHVGPNRIHVKLARKLASSGFVAMRFDFSGIGDSRPRLDGKPFAQSSPEEIRQSLDYLESSRGIHRFVLVGVCSGADNALRAGALDPRVEGAVAIEGHAIATPAYLFRLYRRRLLSPRSWLRLLSGRSEIAGMLRFSRKSRWARRAGGTREANVRSETLSPVKREIVDSIRTFDARGARLLLIYSSGSASHLFYETSVRRRVADIRKRGSLEERFVSGADHVFTHQTTQTELLNAIFDWVLELRHSPERPDGSIEAGVRGRFVPASS